MKRFWAFLLAITMLMSLTVCAVSAKEEKKTVDVMFVHDMHSHLESFATVEDGKSQVLGGFARIKTLINEQKEKNPDTLLLDAGDFSMGTLIQAVYEQEASEIRMLGELGIDVTTFGNHEYDYKAKGLANMLKNAVASGDSLPEIVVSNVDWEGMKHNGLTKDQEAIKEGFDTYGVKEYTMVEKNGVKIAVVGAFGADAYDCVPNCPLDFKDTVEALKETVNKIKKNERADMIVCVSHSGVWENEEKSEDEILAKEVPEIDLIISGHTHTKLDEPIVHGDTYIVSAAEYGKYLGSLSMSQKKDGRWEMSSYELLMVEEKIKEDEETQKKVDELMSMVDSKYLDQFGYTKDQILCTNDIDFTTSSDAGEKHTEQNLGSIMADAYTYAVEHSENEDKHPVDVAVVPAGTIRDTYAKGNITTENVFNSFSLGIGKDEIPGYPLISVYLTGAELKTVAEIDSSVSDLMTTARLYTDGLYWTYNPNRMILNKATDVYLCDGDEKRVELEDDALYRVVTDFYSSQMLGGVTDMSYGLLSIVPKFADGTPIENYEDAIITSNGQELKAWVAIAQYMQSFEDTDGDGVGEVPEKYGTLEGRKVIEDSKKIGDLIKNPNKFFFIIVGAVLLILVLLTLVIWLIVKLVKKLLKKTNQKMNTKRIALNAVLIATYIVLSMLAFNLGPIKFTFEAFPVILCAVIFGPIDAMIVGGIGELLNQLLTFGITPTTVLWILPIVSRGLIVGIVAKLWKKKSGDTGIVEKKNPTVFFVVCIVTAIIHSILNTLALYVDSKMFGYYSYALVFGALFVRLLSSVITAIIMALTIKMVVHALKKASLI